VHKALKISPPADSEDNSRPKENHVPKKEVLVEKDQINSAEGENEGVPQDNTTPAKDDAPNLEKKDKSPITTDKNGGEVNSIFLLSTSPFSSNS
jgi:hypothetical protein